MSLDVFKQVKLLSIVKRVTLMFVVLQRLSFYVLLVCGSRDSKASSSYMLYENTLPTA